MAPGRTRERTPLGAHDSNRVGQTAGMISLLSISKRFVYIMRAGWREPEFRGLALISGSWLALGTIVYSIYEDWSVLESLYFCVMTLTTIGYGDYTPTDSTMQAYTIFYALLGIGFFVAFTTKVVAVALASREGEDTNGA